MGVRVSVVVASHARPLRLWWLLNALEEQSLPAADWDVVVVHDYDPGTSARILDSHPLAAAGPLSHIAIPPGTARPSRQRNLGWRQARGSLLAFVDDDCRPEPGWLDALVAAAELHPGSFVQGETRPDPYEEDVFAAPHVRTLSSKPPNRFAQTCNILYPRSVLERVGGLDEEVITGEDMDLGIRAREAGAEHVAAPEAIVFHAVEAMTLPEAVRDGWWWHHLALVVKRHPELRAGFPLGIFWDTDHLLATLALAGAFASPRHRGAALLALPWIARELVRRGGRPGEVAVSALELPGRAVRDFARTLTFAAGSARYRALVL